jgi:transposase
MPAKRLSMRKTREILRLRLGLGLSLRDTARSVRVSSSTVSECVTRAAKAGLGWPLPPELDDAALESRLYPSEVAQRNRPMPDFRRVHTELRRKGVTLELLWHEYRATHPDGYGYSRFCELYREFCGSLDPVMRQVHRPGEKLFVDFAGTTVPIVDPANGEVHEAAVFVAAMGASSFTYAEALHSQQLRHWLSAHVNAFEFLGGVPHVLVPDNLKAAVSRPDFYDPDLNPSYQELAHHYGAVIIPARVRKPRDKAKVENAVQQVERWVLAPLRNQRFFSLAEANSAIRSRLSWLNERPLSKLEGTRRSLFEELDRPQLKPLPQKRFEIPEWRVHVAVNIDYHVEFDGHYYSVPYALVQKRVDVRATASTVECLYHGQRVASHPRSYVRGQYTTAEQHRPKTHRHFASWTPSRLVRWASTVGPETAAAVQAVMQNRKHPEQGFRSALGIIRLADRYGKGRVERACSRARDLRSLNYRTIQSLLKNGLEQTAVTASPPPRSLALQHENVRGPDYYN